MNPLVAIVIPVFNTEAYVGECLESVLKQTYGNFEVFAADDGSGDGSLEVLKRFAAADRRIRVIAKPRTGVSDTRNAALREIFRSGAPYRFVKFLDSDDILHPEYLASCVKALRENGASYAVCGWEQFTRSEPHSPASLRFSAERIDQDEVCAQFFGLSRFGDRAAPESRATSKFLGNRIFSTELIRGCFFDTRYQIGEDFEFELRVLPFVKTGVLLPDTLFFYRRRKSSLVNAGTGRNSEPMYEILKHALENSQNRSEFLRRGVQTEFLRMLWAEVTRHFISRDVPAAKRRAFYEEAKKLADRAYEFPLSANDRRRLDLLKLGYAANRAYFLIKAARFGLKRLKKSETRDFFD